MKTQFKELLENYKQNFTNKSHHDAIQNNLRNFETTQIIDFCEKEIQSKTILENELNTNFVMKLIDYSARTDSYFEEQRNKLLNYSLALGGFSATYITTVIGLYQSNFLNANLFYTVWGFGLILLGCIITLIIYIFSFSPRYPHRKKSYSPFFFIYNVCSKFSFLSFSFIPKSIEKNNEALKAFHLDLTTYIDKISDLTKDYSSLYKSCLTQVLMLFRTSQNKSKSANLMRSILSISFSVGFIVYFILLIIAIFS